MGHRGREPRRLLRLCPVFGIGPERLAAFAIVLSGVGRESVFKERLRRSSYTNQYMLYYQYVNGENGINLPER